MNGASSLDTDKVCLANGVKAGEETRLGESLSTLAAGQERVYHGGRSRSGGLTQDGPVYTQ